jgi:hypothetical protein
MLLNQEGLPVTHAPLRHYRLPRARASTPPQHTSGCRTHTLSPDASFRDVTFSGSSPDQGPETLPLPCAPPAAAAAAAAGVLKWARVPCLVGTKTARPNHHKAGWPGACAQLLLQLQEAKPADQPAAADPATFSCCLLRNTGCHITHATHTLQTKNREQLLQSAAVQSLPSSTRPSTRSSTKPMARPCTVEEQQHRAQKGSGGRASWLLLLLLLLAG